MNKQDVIEFFDRLAPGWDVESVPEPRIINRILDYAQVREGQRVLDVACGTGVLFPYYMEHGVGSVTGIDLSPEMAKLAAKKFDAEPRIKVVCGDVEEWTPDAPYDLVMVHNALPHFPDAQRLIHTLSAMLAEGGRLAVAHSASRAVIDAHHSGGAKHVSNGLMSAESLSELFERDFTVDVVVSDNEMYMVSGIVSQ